MGYLSNESITVDAILTNRGREILATDPANFNITQFALADDEIDYGLWNENHSLGSNYYGIVIENMPILEAVPTETQVMKYKLITLPRNTTKIPVLTLDVYAITLFADLTSTITPGIGNIVGSDLLGYTAILSDRSVCDMVVAPGGEISTTFTPPAFTSQEGTLIVVGNKFLITAKRLTTAKTATITIIGNQTGGIAQCTVTVNAYDPSGLGV